MGGLGAAAAGFGTAGAALAAPARRKAVAPSDRIRVGAIGVRGMGSSNMGSMLDIDGVECAALCDVDRNVLDRAVEGFTELTDSKPDAYTDYRKLLEDDELDAVIVATPDHWHCKIMVDACEAGARAWAYMGWDAPVHVPDSKPPKGVDYDMWLGPAPKRPFNENRFHWNFRWYWDYAGGLMTDWGVHLIDMVLMGMKATAPKSVMSLGGPFGYPDAPIETPDTQQAVYEFDDFTMIWEHALGIALGPHRRGHGVSFVGNKGTLVIDRSGWEVLPEVGRENGRRFYKTPAIPDRTASRSQRGLAQHTEDFIECMKTREQPRCNADVGALVAVNAHLGNIAFRTGRRVYWDQEAGRFKGDDEANAMLRAEYHNGWRLPRVTGAEASAG